MFRDLFNYLLEKAVSLDLKEHIATFRDSDAINETSPSGKAHRAVHGALTSIANVAYEEGEREICITAREMRDENNNKFEEDY